MESKAIYIETFGCQMNMADSERVATILVTSGYSLTNRLQEADIVLLNTCSIRERAEHKLFTRVGEIKKNSAGSEPLIGVLGCVAQLEGESIFEQAPSIRFVVGTKSIKLVPELIQRALNGEQRVTDIYGSEGEDWTVSPAERHSKYVAFVPIINGCNKFCTYCIVPFSRGRETSRPAGDIINEINGLREEGYKEVHLIGQNVNSYRPKSDSGFEGFKGATPFSRLLRAVSATKMERIKFTTSFPRDFHPDIVAAIEENENLCNWVHLPVQSGNNRVLKAMKRGHDVDDYLRRVEVIKSSSRRIALTSDVIVGFPGETADEFEDTLRLVKRCEFDGLYIFKYSKRKGTPAANLPDLVNKEEKTRRFRALEELQKGIQAAVYSSYLDRKVSVLVEGLSARREEDLTGHTTCNKVVNFKSEQNLIGKIVNIVVKEAKPNSLYGELVR